MAMALRLRRALALSSSVLLHRPLTRSLPFLPAHLISQNCTIKPAFSKLFSSDTTTTTTSSKVYGPHNVYEFNAEHGGHFLEVDPTDESSALSDDFHWMIMVDIPQEVQSLQDTIGFYEGIAARVFGSIGEARKRIYACGTAYEGFQVECLPEDADKFMDLPGVRLVFPDTYSDVEEEGFSAIGVRYVNGEIFTRQPVPPLQHKFGQPPLPQHNYGEKKDCGYAGFSGAGQHGS